MTTGERKPRWWSRDSFFLILTGHRTIQCGCSVVERCGREAGIAVLSGAEEAETLAAALVKQAAVPAKAIVGAAHVAIAAVHGLDFLRPGTARNLRMLRCGHA